jgi:hypothetical protein
MDKVTINIDPENWGNLITKYQAHSPKLKETDFTQGTINVDTASNGSLSKRKGGPNYNQTLLPAALKDQYEAIFSDGARHLLVVMNGEIRYSSGDTIFNTVANGTGFSTGGNFEFATTQDRVYGGNAINAPIIYDRITNYGGVVYTVPRTKSMGAQAPSSAASVAVVAGGSVPSGGHTYKVTFVYYDSEESNGGPASALATTTPGNQTVNLTAIPIGGYGVTQRNIYRDNNDTNWVMVGYIANNTATTFSDTVATGATPLPIPQDQGVPPSFGLIKLWLDRLWLAQVPGDPYTLFYSEASQPDIFQSANQVLCNPEDPITALIVYFDRLIVFNRRSMGQILGDTPDTFRYATIPGSVGCVDNRTLQIRVISGVPILIWLSERGFYTYDGNAIDYVSDWIEDLVNYNIRQATQQKNSNVTTSQAQFQSGTASNGIDLTDLPGSVTTKGYFEGTSTPGTNPRRDFNDQADWESGSQIDNLALKGGHNQVKAILSGNFTGLTGTRSGGMVPTGNIELTLSSIYNGDGSTSSSVSVGDITTSAMAGRFNVPRAGTITSISTRIANTGVSSKNCKLTIWDNSGNVPGSILFESAPIAVAPGASTKTSACSVYISATTDIWIGIQRISSSDPLYLGGRSTGTVDYVKTLVGSTWGTTAVGTAKSPAASFTFTVTPIPNSGTWVSNTQDTMSGSVTQANLVALFSTGVSSFGSRTYSIIVEQSTDGLIFTQTYISTTRASINTTIPLTQRYYRVRINMSTTDDRGTDIVSLVNVNFPNNVEWISSAIDCSSDVVSYDSLVATATTTPFDTIQVLIASSPDNITYTTYQAVGAVPVQRYAKLKLILTRGSSFSTPAISALVFKWTLTSNLVSAAIDTAVVPPAGWDVFLSQYTTNGGTVQFQMRSSATLLGLSSATFQNVTPGDFPFAVTPLQYLQWKVILTSSDLQVPVIDSVTVQWLISLVASIRPASIFVDGRYYVALAELNNNTNNLILELDLNSKWRRLSGIQIATMSFFFNRPYIGLATSGQVRKFLEGYTDAGTPIEFDVRTKAFDFSTQWKDISEKYKITGEIIVHAKNTGAALQFFYSPDEGLNFYPFYTLSGSTTYQTTSTGDDFFLRLKPMWIGSNPIAGQHLMYRIYSNDIYNVEIHSIKVNALVRKQPPVITG